MNLKKKVNMKIPNHVAIILDGNGRWAKKRGMPRTYGHERGLNKLIEIARYCNEIGVKELTVYAFSTENWNRPKDEVDYLMTAPVEYLNDNLEKLKGKNVKINFVGRKDRLPITTLDAINKIVSDTKENEGMMLNIAFDYGGRNDIVEATKIIAKKVSNKEISIHDIDEKYFGSQLYVKTNVDLLIRTGGELRVSNFLLWQLSYAEFYFTKRLWPEFSKKELSKAVKSFNKRKRRFGGVK